MTKKGSLPKSRARTAYGLLSEVRRIILAEPKRFNQQIYIARRGGENGADPVEDQRAIPSCGTVGCVAGWVATLKRGEAFRYGEAPYVAQDILGLTVVQRQELFAGSALDRMTTAKPQTKTYALFGARHIAAFQKKYAEQLKAKAV